MSSKTLISFDKKGEQQEVKEYRNSHRWAIFHWTQFAEKYLIKKDHMENPLESGFIFMMDEEKAKKLWALSKDSKLPLYERACLTASYDNVVLKHENIEKFCGHILEFANDFKLGHYAQMYLDLLELVNDKDCLGVCWIATSVCGDAWQVYEGEDNCRGYNLLKDKGHYFLYDDVAVKLDGADND